MLSAVNEIIRNEPLLRGLLFFAVVTLLLLWERRAPLRTPRPIRNYLPNVLLFLTNTGVQRAVSIYSLVGISLYGEAHPIGLTHQLAIPLWFATVGALIALDLGVYFQHRLFHWVPLFWRLHAVHHSDTCFDTTTGLRFHVGEMLLSLIIKSALVLALGAPALAVLIFEGLLSSSSLFTHANVSLPAWLDSLLRLVVVTPNMHRIHHSVHADEHGRNFGFLLSSWDRCLGSYLAQAREDQAQMSIGLARFRAPEQQVFMTLIAQPFHRGPG